MDRPDVSRRMFLASTGGALTSAWLAANWPGIAAAAQHAGHAATALVPTSFSFLNALDAADVSAIAAQILPSGATPGAREAHVIYFIDHALATFFADRAAAFRTGLTEFQRAFHASHSATASFAAASADEQLAFLNTVDRTAFFESMRVLTLLGTLSSTQYGGNYQGVGWKLIGFEDQHIFFPPFGYYDRDYAGFEPYGAEKQA